MRKRILCGQPGFFRSERLAWRCGGRRRASPGTSADRCSSAPVRYSLGRARARGCRVADQLPVQSHRIVLAAYGDLEFVPFRRRAHDGRPEELRGLAEERAGPVDGRGPGRPDLVDLDLEAPLDGAERGFRSAHARGRGKRRKTPEVSSSRQRSHSRRRTKSAGVGRVHQKSPRSSPGTDSRRSSTTTKSPAPARAHCPCSAPLKSQRNPSRVARGWEPAAVDESTGRSSTRSAARRPRDRRDRDRRVAPSLPTQSQAPCPRAPRRRR